MQKILSKLFREIESDLGTHKFAMMVLDALRDALVQYKSLPSQRLKTQLLQIFMMLQKTKPRYAMLLNSFYKVLEACEGKSSKNRIEQISLVLSRINTSYQLEKLQMVQNTGGLNLDGKNILIHDHSHSVHSFLTALKQQGQEFSVIVAGQDLEKTEDNILFLHNHGIDHKVVPAHMLSHVEKVVDIVFCGATTMQENYHFVMDPGSKAVISHFRLEKKPIYAFLTTSKFSLWPLTDKSQESFYKTQKKKHHIQKEIEFSLLKFSHDRVPVDLVDYIVTEKGMYKPAEVKDMFDQMFKERKKMRKKYLK